MLNRIKGYFQAWVVKRIPAKESHRLTHKNLFIFPSKLGGGYLLLVALLWLLGTNYENNAILAVSYLLLSLFLISIFHCFFNLQGLVVKVAKPVSVFNGEQAPVVLRFERQSDKSQHSVEIAWRGQRKQMLDWQDSLSQEMTLPYRAQKRGLLNVPLLSLRSYYPLGLIRCWCYLPLQSYVIAYPKPIEQEQPLNQQGDGEPTDQTSAQSSQETSNQEFESLAEYRQGEPLSHISWKHYARTDMLYKKNYAGFRSDSLELNWDHYSEPDTEVRLSYLCHQALTLNAQNKPFSLKLPNTTIERAEGEGHLLDVLEALALFDTQLPPTFATRRS